MLFYLGTHEPGWLSRLTVPLFVSHRRLARRRALPVARCRWALDSGGFSELALHGRWVTGPAEYADAVQRYGAEIGSLDWAAPQDWMCEPQMRERTGRSVGWHQAATVESVCRLRALVPDVTVICVLQGWVVGDYLAHIDTYRCAGVDPASEPVVGLGSVCRRQHTGEIAGIVHELSRAGLALHGFGVKTQGLAGYADQLASADSMAWSYAARRRPPLAGCSHRRCNNCSRFALAWREQVLARADSPQGRLF